MSKIMYALFSVQGIASVCFLLSFNCLAQEEIVNECGQTRSEWSFQDTRCMEISDGQVVESFFSFFSGAEPVVTVGVMTIEELEEQWELAE